MFKSHNADGPDTGKRPFRPGLADEVGVDAGPSQWESVRMRLREEIGEEKFNSWFARMELDSLASDVVHLSVPTRFLKSWI